jgi:hypothetical protein
MKTALLALASVLLATTSLAQGSLSTQGFGYPPGQLSSRAESMGGASAEVDPWSAVNPAATAGTGVLSLYFQYDPEFRTVTANGATSSTTTARFPLVGLIFPITASWNIALGSSTLVDRSSETRTTRRQPVGSSTGSIDTVTVNDRVRTLGAIDDVRFALGWAASPALHLGVGAHILTGTNQITVRETFPDSAKFTNVLQSSRLSYNGTAMSAGMEWHPSKVLALGVSGRKGGTIRAESGDTVLATAKVPDHYGAALQYSGWGDANFAVHIARDMWSSMHALTTSTVTAYDAWDVGIGGEATGTRLASRPLTLRVGVRDRTLPFSTTGSSVREISFAAGIGIDLSHNRANLDLGLQRASRSSSSSVAEHAYILSFGLRVIP